MSLKDFVIQHVDPAAYYQSRFPKWDSKFRPNVLCPFHEDIQPSLSLALKNGGARCHASSCDRAAHGNIVHFESDLKRIPEKQAARDLYKEFVRKIISRKVVKRYCDDLHYEGDLILRIIRELGLNASSIKRFSLGYDIKTRRLTIPVYDQFENIVNIRYYKIPSFRTKADKARIFNYKKGYGTYDLFPQHVIKNYTPDRPLYFMSAETETMLAIQDGLQAVCSTAGEGSWNADWQEFFTGYDVYTIFDRDTGGDRATVKITEELKTVGATSVTKINLPFKSSRKDRKDYRDWRLKEKGNPKKLEQYVSTKRSIKRATRVGRSSDTVAGDRSSNRRVVECKLRKVDAPSLPDYATDESVALADIGANPAYLNKRIRTQGIVAAKATNTYSVPWKFKIEVKNRPAFEYRLSYGRELLRFVRAADATVLQSLQEILGSESCKITPISYITATEVEIIPIAAADKDVPYVTQRCFYFGPDIKANVAYDLDIIPTSEIRTQETIGIIVMHEPISKTIETFNLTNEIQTELRGYFNPHEDETVWDKLKDLGHEFSNNYTHIFNRLDWHIAALLSWASPLQLQFPDDPVIKRGWLNTLAIGDSETGKSKVCETLQQLTNCGIFVDSENCTYVGLIGGAVKNSSGQFMLKWGRIPLSDKQLVVLEELSGLSVSEISNMSNVRSSGIARLDKGGINSQTNCRTRLICLSNVRSIRKSLSTYLYGILAVQELIGHGEDIARFDLITTLVDAEVDVATINSADNPRYTDSTNHGLGLAFKNLIHYIWSLEASDIIFSESAWNECLEQTKKLSSIYHSSIPVFKGGSGRYKLGRIAAAIACLQFARRGDKICVQADHVRAAAKLLRTIYDKPSFGYRQYSQQMYDRENLQNEETLKLVMREKLNPKHIPDTLENLIHQTRFNRDELCALAGVPNFVADQLISSMLRTRVIRKEQENNNIWAITPAGKVWMENYLSKLKHKTKHKHGRNGTKS